MLVLWRKRKTTRQIKKSDRTQKNRVYERGAAVITKHELQRYLQIDAQIDELVAERCALMDRATKITPALNGMPHAPGVSDKIGNAVALIDSIDQKIAEKMTELREEKDKIECAISCVQDVRMQTVLRYKYICGMTLERIAEKMDVSERHIIRMHMSALDKILDA